MSLTDQSGSTQRRAPIDWVIIVAVALALIAILVFLTSQRQQVLRTSPSGYDGLSIWLRDQDVPSQVFTGGWTLDPQNIGMLVIPVYDTNPNLKRIPPKTQEELILQRDENDNRSASLRARASGVNTLIILPKWRSGMRLTGIAHPSLLIEPDRNQFVLDAVTGARTGDVSYVDSPFTTFRYSGQDGSNLSAELYLAQVFTGSGCTPIIGQEGEMVLGKCPVVGTDSEEEVYILSDPDLFSNHGLRLADNAAIAADFFVKQAADQPVLIDYSSENWLQKSERREAHTRTWSDLARFFEPPFIVLWLGSAIAMLLTIWRSGFRFGPVPKPATSLRSGKLLALQAQARLLRRTGQDGALLQDYVEARLGTAATQLLGPGAPGAKQAQAALLKHLQRNAPKLADQLANLLERINAVPKWTAAHVAIAYVDELETILEHVTHDT